jgi:hypothetical protein
MSKTKAQVLEDVALLRKQLRNAWAKLGCRCIFNDQDEKIFEEPHCPYHGVYQNDPDGWDPIGDLQKAITARWWEEISKPEENFKGGLADKYGSAGEEDRKRLQHQLEIWFADQGYTWEHKALKVTLVKASAPR